MFVHDGKYCQVETWFHDLRNNRTQATLYRYETEEAANLKQGEIASDIFVFDYASGLESLSGIEAEVQESL